MTLGGGSEAKRSVFSIGPPRSAHLDRETVWMRTSP